MKKKPFVTLEKLQEITEKYPTPFHLYDEKGIRENAKALKEAFAWNKGFKEFFAVKATPNPYLIQILQEYGCGCDCSSMTELMLSKAIGCKKGDIMFSSNDTPEAEFRYANEIGGIINLDDITHIKAVEKAVGYIPKTISCRYNPGGVFKISNDIMDNPGDAKYGMTTEQIFEAFRTLKAKGAENFGIHAFLASNTVTNEYYPMLAKVMFELAVKLQKETGAHSHCILSIAGLPNSHIAANRIFHAFHRTTLMQIQHSKFLKIWNIQSSHLIQDMSERIHTLIAKFLRIRHCSNPQ